MIPRISRFAVAAAAVLALGDSLARTLDARFDRNPIHVGETVRLVLETDAPVTGIRPDTSPLLRDFDVLGESARMRDATGGTDRGTRIEWVIELAPKRSGRIAVGPLRAETMTSRVLALEVLPAASRDDQSARDVYLELDVTPREAYVSSQITCVLRIYRAVEFFEARLSDFEPEGVVLHRLGRESRFDRVIDGRRYRVVERRFALFPQASGRLALPAFRLDARIGEAIDSSTLGGVFDPGRLVRVETEPVVVVVKPRPDTAAIPWLPARALSLTEEWPENPPRLVAGEPVTWTVRLQAAGLSGEQLPPIDTSGIDGARVYPDQPTIATRADGHGLQGERIQQMAMVAGAAGQLRIPELKLAWWDVEADAPRVARIPARTVVIAPAPDAASILPPAPGSAANGTGGRLWQGISAALAVAWLATLATLLRIRRRRRGGNAVAASPAGDTPPNTAAARRRVLDACRRSDPRAARDALLRWADFAWPTSPPRDLIALVARIDDASLAAAILALDDALWSSRSTSWTGRSLAARLPRALGSHTPPRPPATADRLSSLHPA